MAGLTVQQIITRFKRSKPECETAFALQLFQDAMVKVGVRTEQMAMPIVIELIQGQREYLMPNNFILLREAYYVTGSAPGMMQYMVETNKDKLALERPGWQAYPSTGNPWWVYIDTQAASNATTPATLSSTGSGSTSIVGFDPIPLASSTGSPPYPNVTLYCTTYNTSIGLSTYLPDNLGGDDMWVDMLEKLYSKAREPQAFALRKEMSDQSVEDTAARLKSSELGDATTMVPSWYARRRSI